jgi:hypothetical protein
VNATLTGTRPTLREIVLDALTDAYYARRTEIEGCRDCTSNPAGICADHQADNAAASEYEEARKQIEHGADPGLIGAVAGELAEVTP